MDDGTGGKKKVVQYKSDSYRYEPWCQYDASQPRRHALVHMPRVHIRL